MTELIHPARYISREMYEAVKQTFRPHRKRTERDVGKYLKQGSFPALRNVLAQFEEDSFGNVSMDNKPVAFVEQDVELVQTEMKPTAYETYDHVSPSILMYLFTFSDHAKLLQASKT